ncbi:MAG: hypothetical protein JNL11_05640 [Bdellovibrionaceae bacterium]|nr:hypothetical protein [Pseudobdellovibrionaceae bacterium]
MKNFFSLLSLTVTVALLSFSAQANDAAAGSSEMNVQSPESTLYITISGESVRSVDDIHNLFIKALGLGAGYSKTFESLQAELVKFKSQRFQVAIAHGGLLSLNIGAEAHDKLLDVLNNAQEKNLDNFGYPNMMVYYWQ